MEIVISPAKKMVSDLDGLPPLRTPRFLNDTEIVLRKLKELDLAGLKNLYKTSDKITALNFERLSCMDLNKNLTPALLSYSGLQFQSMGAGVFDDKSYEYLDEHLFILSAFYGMIRPFDGVTPYRLEMAAKLQLADKQNLYAFWQDKITGELLKLGGTVINLASDEYSKVIDRTKIKLIDVFFPMKVGDKLVERGSLCKQARGAMVRFLAENKAESPQIMKDFSAYGFTYSKIRSDENNYVFVKDE